MLFWYGIIQVIWASWPFVQFFSDDAVNFHNRINAKGKLLSTYMGKTNTKWILFDNYCDRSPHHKPGLLPCLWLYRNQELITARCIMMFLNKHLHQTPLECLTFELKRNAVGHKPFYILQQKFAWEATMHNLD